MSRHHHNHSQLPEMDHIRPMNGPLDQMQFVHPGSDASLRTGPLGRGSAAIRSNNLPSSSHASYHPGDKVKNTGDSLPFIQYPVGSSSSHFTYDAQTGPVVNYPQRYEEGLAPVSSHLDNRRAALKRKNPISHHVEGSNVSGYYAGSSSSTQYSNYVQPTPTTLAEPFIPQVHSSIGPSSWNDQPLIKQEGSHRNVRARHNCGNVPSEPRPVHSTSTVSLNTSMERNRTTFSMQTRTVPSGTSGFTSRGLSVRPYHPAMGHSNSTVAPVPTVHGSSDNTILTNGGSAPRVVHSHTVPSYGHLSSSSSSYRAIPSGAIIPSYRPATSAATSTSLRASQQFPSGAIAPSIYAQHVPTGHANSGRIRRARNVYDGFHSLVIGAELVSHESRGPDPHRDMRLDVDNMSYEDLLSLGEFIGNVNTGLTSEKISSCVREVICCSSDQNEDDQDDGSCAICLMEYKDKDLLGILKCNHDYHTECIKKWLQLKNSCPVCKAAAV